MHTFLEDEICLEIKRDGSLSKKRSCWRRNILEIDGSGYKLVNFVGQKIPYFYRDAEKISKDFFDKLPIFSNVADLCTKLPTEEHHRCSHFGEILSSIYIEEVLGYKILIRKMTQLTAENTNVHKMDVMCVDTSKNPYKYLWFEVKTSRQHHGDGEYVYHKHGIYKQMKESLEKYTEKDKLFDFVQIRDNLSGSDFTEEERNQIRKDLCPPRPTISFHGVAVINISTIHENDEEYILTEKSMTDFDVRILTLTDLKELAIEAYNKIEDVRKAAEVFNV